jgi:uncharacterized protein (TIGR03067 family)
MRAIAVMLILCTNIQCGERRPAKPEMKDADRIQGAWELVAGERHGETFSDELVKNVTLTFTGDTLKTKNGGNVTEATFKLHPEMKPKGIDLIMEDSAGLGIYKFERDALTILHGEIDEPRPNDFDIQKNDMLTLLILKRAEK